MHPLQSTIESAWDDRSLLKNTQTQEAIRECIRLLDVGKIRVAHQVSQGEWQVNERTFDLATAYTEDNKLSWTVKAPKLKERGGEIIIKDIQITFHKKGWL